MRIEFPARIKGFVLLLSLLLGAACLFFIWRMAYKTRIGSGDFVGYWSASSLVLRGQNPYDPGLLKTLQDEVLDPDLDFAVMAWNPPTLFVFLLPVAALSFTAAKATWLVMNVLLLFALGVMLAKIYRLEDHPGLLLTFILFSALFPQALSGVMMGQVTFLVSIGLAACILLIRRGQWFWAGFVLILISVKPHMALLAWIYVMALMVRLRKFQGWLGFATAGLLAAGVLFVYRPEWVSDFLSQLADTPTAWSTPTIGGVLSTLGITEAGRYLILLFIPLSFYFTRRHQDFSPAYSIAFLTAITVPTTIFGWSYDQTILLFPIAQIFAWLPEIRRKLLLRGAALLIALAFITNYYHRMVAQDEVYFVWVPIFWLILFLIIRAARPWTPAYQQRLKA